MNLLEKVLNYLEPNVEKQKYWMETQSLFSPSQAECMLLFKQELEDIKEYGERVLVAGDYDCDGICATTIMVHGLRHYGIDCGFYIPNRIKEGYGLSINTVELAYKKGYSTIITVDNGVKAFEALERAAQLNMRVIVTDHHTIDQEVDCDILIHPTTLEDSFSNLCGAAIAYECMRVLDMDNPYYLQLAAIASVGDVMEVTKETRAIIQQGLLIMNKQPDPHIHALQPGPYDETTIGFQIVPKLNAVGRLADLANVNNVVRFFLDLNPMNIQKFKEQAEYINNTRKQLSDVVYNQAISKINKEEDILLVVDPSFHEGIIGLVAGRIMNEFQKPTIVMSESDGICKASMRAPDGFDCMEFFSSFSYFSAFGGHKLAAGFSVKVEDMPSFVEYIRNRCQTYRFEIVEKKYMVIEESDCSVAEIESLNVLRPFGQGFPFPNMKLEEPKIKSCFQIQGGKHCKYTLQSNLECMLFNQSRENTFHSPYEIKGLIGTLSINTFRQKRSVNFLIDEIEY
ncbi:MAG: DHH family phosphoesterase [Bacillota bacterium]|nr:DHH family phosphoesterase [Bacillota bacterium]